MTESQADGFIPFISLDEDIMLHPGRIKVTGLKSGMIWRIGDRVSVEIYDVDLDKRQIDLRMRSATIDESH